MSPAATARLSLIATVVALLAGSPATGSSLALAASAPSEFDRSLDPLRESVKTRKWAEAETMARASLKEAETTFGSESGQAAEVLDMLVLALWRDGKASEAETRRLAERAVKLDEALYGPDDAKVATALNSLACVIRYHEGEAASLPFYERSLGIRERSLGPNHPDVGKSLANLAGVYTRIGDYAAAKPLIERSIGILEATLGPENPEIAPALNSEAIILKRLGDYDAAKLIFERMLRAQLKVLGPDSDQAAGTLLNLGGLLGEMGDYPAARERMEGWLRIAEKLAGGAPSPGLTVGLVNLGEVLLKMGETARARSLIDRAIACRKGIDEEGDIDGARAKIVRAEVMAATGRFDQAKSDYLRAIPILEKNLALNHPELAGPLGGLARLNWAMGDTEPALENAVRAGSIARALFEQTTHALTEREALQYERVRLSGMDIMLSVLQTAPSQRLRTDHTGEVWDHLIRSRALVLDEMALRHHAALTDEDPEVARLTHELVLARSRLSSIVVRGPERGESAAYQTQLGQLRHESERAEQALAERSATFRDRLGAARVGLAEVRAALPAGAALVAYVEYQRLPRSPARIEISPSPSSTTRSYAAFVLRSDRKEPEMIPLGTASDIERLVAAWRVSITSAPTETPIPNGVAEERYRAAAAPLGHAIWDPLTRHLAGSSPVFVVPDGALHLVNLSTLPAGDGGYLTETGPLLHYLSAERDLVRHARPPASVGRGMLALGGPDFNARPADAAFESGAATVASSQGTTPTVLARAGAYRGPTAGCETFRTLRFDQVPGAAAEAVDVGSAWLSRTDPSDEPVMTLTGARASESAFKQMAPGRRILHLATHGFFVQDKCESAIAGGALTARSDNPLLLTGLALAGANRRQEVRFDVGEEDGILTAEEVASLNLSGVQWAVLSACGTGTGEILAGEGVLGLRRAFEMAGAGTLIMSLWAVEDEASREWMRGLYQARARGMSTVEAVRAASNGMIAAQRSGRKSTHPFYWGGFVAAGDWN